MQISFNTRIVILKEKYNLKKFCLYLLNSEMHGLLYSFIVIGYGYTQYTLYIIIKYDL